MADLTTAQKQALKAYIVADPVLGPKSYGPGSDYQFIADAMNAAQAAFYVYKSSADTPELGQLINYVAFAAMTATNQSQWMNFLAMNPNNYDPSRTDIQGFMANTWSGALGGQGQATRDALVAYGKRQALLVEKILANISGGNGAVATPAKLTFEGTLNVFDIGPIMGV